jgi:hypothetical protein
VSCDLVPAPLALLAGAAGLGFAGYCLVRAARLDRGAREALRPWACLLLFALLDVVLISAARCGFGWRYGLQSRYATHTGPFWVSLAAIATAVSARGGLPARLRRPVRLAAASLAALFLLSTALSLLVMRNRAVRLRAARDEMLTLTRPERLLEVFPDTAFLVERLPLFFRHRVPPFDGVPALEDCRPVAAAAGAVESVEPFRDPARGGAADGLRVSGRALDPLRGGPARYALFVADGALVFATRPGPNGRWAVRLPSSLFAGPSADLAVWAVSRGGGRARARLDGPPGAGRVAIPRAPPPPFCYERSFFAP